MKKLPAALVALLSPALLLAAAPEPPKWISEGPKVDAPEFAFELPLEVLATKLFVEIELGGRTRRFVFDTGSPSMMSSELASELGLEIIERRQGRDAHGALVDTAVAQADLTLGGTTFRKVPVFIAEFPPNARCLFDGVLGSELLPLCAWQIDLPQAALRCSSNLQQLDHIEAASSLALHDFGYPHAPILDIRLAKKATSKAMLDTGSPEYFAIAPPDYEGTRRNRGVSATRAGAGSLGSSLGGHAPDGSQLLVELKSLHIGPLDLGRVIAPLRESAPSLIGASVLEHFVVTLDSSTRTAYFDRYREGPYIRPSYGFSLSFQTQPQVSLIWEDSPAASAGLKLGQRVDSINGMPTDTSCDSLRRAMQAMSDGDAIELESGGRVISLKRSPVDAK